MQVTVTVPDELAAALMPADRDPARAALQAIGIEAYREHRITGYQLRLLLGIPSRFELDAFLKEHRVETYTAEDFEHDVSDITSPPA